jgi:hypothetical protein
MLQSRYSESAVHVSSVRSFFVDLSRLAGGLLEESALPWRKHSDLKHHFYAFDSYGGITKWGVRSDTNPWSGSDLGR